MKKPISRGFKPRDYLSVVFSEGQFADFQYNPEMEPALDKFIKDIKAGTRSFGDYPTNQLHIFANKIYELREN